MEATQFPEVDECQFVCIGTRVFGLPPRLDTPELRQIITKVQSTGRISKGEATKLRNVLSDGAVIAISRSFIFRPKWRNSLNPTKNEKPKTAG
jgi:hypothetical protein